MIDSVLVLFLRSYLVLGVTAGHAADWLCGSVWPPIRRGLARAAWAAYMVVGIPLVIIPANLALYLVRAALEAVRDLLVDIPGEYRHVARRFRAGTFGRPPCAPRLRP